MYIGKTSDFTKRMSKHKNIALGSHPKEFKSIHFAISKYGWVSFEKFILSEHSDEKEAYEMEIFWIKFFDSKINGYNETIGGEGAGSGIDNPMFGKSHTVSAKAAMSEKRKGKLNPNFGKQFSENSKKIMSAKKIDVYNGENNPRAKLTNIQVKEIREKSKSYSINELSIEYGVKRNVIERIIRGETYKNV